MEHYVDENELFYETVLSKGKGYPTKKLEKMLYDIGTNTIHKMNYSYDEDRLDCLQEGLLILFSKWDQINIQKYKKALPYFTELFKRGMAKSYNEIVKKNKPSQTGNYIFISMSDIHTM